MVAHFSTHEHIAPNMPPSLPDDSIPKWTIPDKTKEKAPDFSRAFGFVRMGPDY